MNLENCESIAHLAHMISRLTTRLSDRRFAELGLSSTQAPLIISLAEDGPASQRALLQHAAIAQPAMVSNLNIMEADGLLVRTTDPQDRRSSIISVTAKGREVAALARPILDEINALATQGLSQTEVQAVTIVMERMISNLDAERSLL